jgi:hypothetical protein
VACVGRKRMSGGVSKASVVCRVQTRTVEHWRLKQVGSSGNVQDERKMHDKRVRL